MLRPGLILLAAGGSSRMGRPKQLLPWGSSTLLRNAGEIALASRCEPVIAVLGSESDACRATLDGLPLHIVTNENWKNGLGSSLATGIAKLEQESPDCSGAVVLLADQPTVTAALLESLIASWSPPVFPIAATRYGNEGGVPALFDRSFFPELRGLDHDRGAKALIVREKSRTVLVEVGENLIDLDTPEAYSALQARSSRFQT